MSENRLLNQLLEDLVGEGDLHSLGRFTLDAAKAREKLAQRQLREAGLWLVKLIQCSHLWQAERLEFRQMRDCTKAHFFLGSQSLDLQPWLGNLQSVEMMADPTLGPLATAFQASLADGCECCWLDDLRLDTKQPEGASLQGDWKRGGEYPKEFVLAFQYARQGPWWNPLLHLRPPRRAAENFLAASRKAGWALPKIALDRYPVVAPARPECKLHLERLWLSSASADELMLYPAPSSPPGRAVVEEVQGRIAARHPQGQASRQWYHEQRENLPLPQSGLESWLEQLAQSGLITPPPRSQGGAVALRGLIQWAVGSSAPACILPVKHGIVLESLPFTVLPDGVTIWLSSSQWRTDISQKRVIQDARSRALTDWCLDQFDHFLAQLLQADSPTRAALAHFKPKLGTQPRYSGFPSLF